MASSLHSHRHHNEEDTATPTPDERQSRTVPPDPLEEWAYIRHWNSKTERHQACTGFIHFYNHHRPHGSLGWATPATILKDNLPAEQN
jgi:transposase InsO family protein